MNRLHQLIAGVFSLILILFFVELGLRLIGFTPRPTMNRFDEVLGWSKEPSSSIRRRTPEFDVALQTNSRGLREDESLGYDKPAGTVRVVMAGDSFTLGYTVDAADTIPALLQDELRSQGRPVEVINGGTEGYSTDQEVLWLANEGRRYSPDVVVLQMYENDVFWNGENRYLRYPKPHLSAHAPGLAAIDDLPHLRDPGREPWIERSTAIGSLLGGILSPPELPTLPEKSLPAEWEVRIRDDASGWPETRAALVAFRALADRIGAKPLVLVIPDKAQVDPAARQAVAQTIAEPAYDPDRPYRGMIAAARAAGLPVSDPLPALVAAFEKDREPLYFARDWHTNRRGNRVLADRLADALGDPSLLGAPPHQAVPLALGSKEAAGEWLALAARRAALVLAAWLVLATLYWRTFPAEGAVRSFASVGGLIAAVVLAIVAFNWLLGLLPPWLARSISSLVVFGVVAAALWYLRARLATMAELFATFVRRGQWALLPVLVGLLTVGALLVVAASSPWLAPFIYTLF